MVAGIVLALGAGTTSEPWSTTIPAGETAELRIYYDPSFQRDAQGAIMREASHSSIDPVVKVSIEVNQVDWTQVAEEL